jgi:hypothetical protein
VQDSADAAIEAHRGCYLSPLKIDRKQEKHVEDIEEDRRALEAHETGARTGARPAV